MLNMRIDLRSPDTWRLENILTIPPLSLTDSTSLTYLFLVGTSADLQSRPISIIILTRMGGGGGGGREFNKIRT